MTRKDFAAMAADPAEFRKTLLVRHGTATLADSLADFQLAALAELDPAILAIEAGKVPPRRGAYWEWSKGSAKTTLAASAILHLLVFSPRALDIRAGAGDLEQAAEVRLAIRDFLRDNPWLTQVITANNWQVSNHQTGSLLQIVSSDAKTGHGGRPDVTFIDELVHIGDEDFIDTLLANQSKKAGGFTLVCSNAGFSSSWQWNKRELWRQSEDWYFSRHAAPPPWISQRMIDALGLLPHTVRRLYWGEWQSGSGMALAADDIAAAFVHRGPFEDWRAVAAADWIPLAAGLDLGVSRDHSAAAILCARAGRLRLAYLQNWPPPLHGKLDLTKLETAIAALHARYRPRIWLADLWQAELLTQRLRGQGVPIEGVAFGISTLQTMATALLEVFNSRQLELYDSPALLQDLHALQLVDRGTSFRLEAPRNKSGHGDRATALLLALLGASRYGDLKNWTWSHVVQYHAPAVELTRQIDRDTNSDWVDARWR